MLEYKSGSIFQGYGMGKVGSAIVGIGSNQ